MLALCDVFVWVTDPQKYADALLHDDYRAAADRALAVTRRRAQPGRPAAHADAVEPVRQDLVRLLELDGVDGVQVLTTSVRTGDGSPRAAAAAGQRCRRARGGTAAARPPTSRRSPGVCAQVSRTRALAGRPQREAELVDALSRAAGVPIVLDAVERDYRQEAWARTGWPFTRWARALRPDPLKRLRLGKGQRTAGTPARSCFRVSPPRKCAVRSGVPRCRRPTPAARSAVELATRRVGERAGQGLPIAWAEAAADAADPARAGAGRHARPGDHQHPAAGARPALVDGLRLRAVALRGGDSRRPRLAAVLGVVGWLRLPEIETPRLGPLPYPFLLLAGGLLFGVLLAALARALARVGARRRAELIQHRLRESVSRVASEHIVAPVREVLRRHAATREAARPGARLTSRRGSRPSTASLRADPAVHSRPPSPVTGRLSPPTLISLPTGTGQTDEVRAMNEIYVTVSGRWSPTPVAQHKSGGVPFAAFRIASTVRRLNRETREYEDAATSFFNVTAFRRSAPTWPARCRRASPSSSTDGCASTSGSGRTTPRPPTVEIDAYSVGHDLSRSARRADPGQPGAADSHDRHGRRGDAGDGASSDAGFEVGDAGRPSEHTRTRSRRTTRAPRLGPVGPAEGPTRLAPGLTPIRALGAPAD